MEVQREYRAAAEILQKKLDLERAAAVAAEERARRLESLLQQEKVLSLLERKRADDLDVNIRETCRELEDEKMARENAEKRLAVLTLEVEAASSDLKLEKLRLQGARERIVLRKSLLRVFHSTVTKIAEVQQDQFSTMLRTLEDGDSDDDPDNTNVQSTMSPSCMKWRAGDMATVIAELRASDGIFFSKLLTHTRMALRRRLQLHGDKLEDWVLLRTRSSTRTWRVRLCFFKKPRGSPQAQIFCGWNDFIADNDLKSGDSLIFVFNVETTCFQVYIFRTGQR